MIRADQQWLTRPYLVRRIVREQETRPAVDHPSITQDREIHIKCDLPQSHHYPKMRQQVQLPLEKITAPPDLLGPGLVPWRSAAHHGRNIDALQPQPILTRRADRLGSEAGGVKHAIQQFTGAIASERPARPIRAMRPGR